MPSFRNLLFQIHLWTGLAAGVFFILLGLSGSALVYPGLLQPQAVVPKGTAQGAPLALEQIIAAAREASPQNRRSAAIVTLPRAAGDAIMVQFNAPRGRGDGGGAGDGAAQARPGAARDGARRNRANRTEGGAQGARGDRANQLERGPQGARGGNQRLFLDPVSGQVLASGNAAQSPLLGIAHQMHEAMLLGGAGRTLVAWLGVGMFFLGLSGLYLWWPRKGQWKFAFGVRRTARGFRLYREIHGMMGIWFWLVFVFVTATSLPLGFPSVLGLITGNAPRGEGPPGQGQAARVEAPGGAAPLPLATLIADAQAKAGGTLVGVTVPAQPDRAISVNFASSDGPPRSVALNPFTGAILSPSGPAQAGAINRGMIEQLHGGQRLGPVWQLLVFLSGFLPLIFVTTGLMMWLKKRNNKKTPARAA